MNAKPHTVPAGYKQTEVGIIPDDWDVFPLEVLCTSITDGTHYTPRYVPSGIPFYSVENITSNDFVNTKFISESEHLSLIRRCKPERGDILMTRITAGILGDTKLIDWDVNASIYVSLALLKPNERIRSEYLYRYSRSSSFLRDVEKRGLKNATPKKINMDAIGAIPIPAPRLSEEQRAIAEALSDVDALNNALDALITKKRNIKQGTMQQLLTGKERLKGFAVKEWKTKETEIGEIPADWEVRRLAELGDWRGGHTPSMKNPAFWNGGDIPWVSSGEVKKPFLADMPNKITKHAVANTSTSVLPTDSIIVVTRSGILRKHLPVALNIVPMAINQDIKALVPSDSTHPRFALHSLTANGPRILASCLKSGTTVESIEFSWLKIYSIPFPPTKEQEAIADVLTDMDREIAALEQKRDKTKLIKQGMMQELLTGKTRLV